MTNTKAVLKSKTFWGIAIVFIADLVQRVRGDSIDQQTQDDTVNAVLAGIEYLGLAIAIVGRWVARHPLSVTGTPTS